jgi:hypothetical protein
MFYSSEPEALREFIRDKLGFTFTDVGEGWLIFDLPEADMGVHPADESGGHGSPTGTHDISFYCDDLKSTVEELRGRGVEFVSDIIDAGFGLVTHFMMPGNVRAQLYQPHYTKGSDASR